MATKTLHLVWNATKSECVGFFDKRDANWTATGDRKFLEVSFASPTIGEDFREAYATGRKALPQTAIEIDTAEAQS